MHMHKFIFERRKEMSVLKKKGSANCNNKLNIER